MLCSLLPFAGPLVKALDHLLVHSCACHRPPCPCPELVDIEMNLHKQQRGPGTFYFAFANARSHETGE